MRNGDGMWHAFSGPSLDDSSTEDDSSASSANVDDEAIENLSMCMDMCPPEELVQRTKLNESDRLKFVKLIQEYDSFPSRPSVDFHYKKKMAFHLCSLTKLKKRRRPLTWQTSFGAMSWRLQVHNAGKGGVLPSTENKEARATQEGGVLHCRLCGQSGQRQKAYGTVPQTSDQKRSGEGPEVEAASA